MNPQSWTRPFNNYHSQADVIATNSMDEAARPRREQNKFFEIRIGRCCHQSKQFPSDILVNENGRARNEVNSKTMARNLPINIIGWLRPCCCCCCWCFSAPLRQHSSVARFFCFCGEFGSGSSAIKLQLLFRNFSSHLNGACCRQFQLIVHCAEPEI